MTKHEAGQKTQPGCLWTAQDVADYLRSSVSFVYKAAEAGRLPCLRICRMLRFDPEMVTRFAQGDQTRTLLMFDNKRRK